MADLWNIEEIRLLRHARRRLIEQYGDYEREFRSVFADSRFKAWAKPLVRAMLEREQQGTDWSWLARKVQSEAWARVKAIIAEGE